MEVTSTVRGGTQCRDGAVATIRFTCFACFSSVKDEEVAERDPIIPSDNSAKVVFDFFGCFLVCQSESSGNPFDVGIDNDPFGFAEKISQYNICRFSSDSGKLE